MSEQRLKEIESQLNLQCSDMTWCVDVIQELISVIRETKDEAPL